MINTDPRILEKTINLSLLGISFSAKPLVFGGLAMEYYGLRVRGEDIDFIIADADYQALASMYPAHRKDIWGDLGVRVGEYELFRSVFRLDYGFYAKGAVEFEQYKVVSFEMLFFMKALAFENQPEVQKHADDFRLVINHLVQSNQNADYVEKAMKHTQSYLAAPNGIILGGQYERSADGS